MSIFGSVIEDNHADGSGGGIEVLGSWVLMDMTTVRENVGQEAGGGISSRSSLLHVSRSTISGNSSGELGVGGGLFLFAGATENRLAELTDVTISGNSAGTGGGIGFDDDNDRAYQVKASFVTIAANTAASQGGGIDNPGAEAGTVELRGSILADNEAPTGPDCSGPITSSGYNLIEAESGCVIGGDATSDVTGQDPRLAPLGLNDGLTETHALGAGSPAIDAVPAEQCNDLNGNSVDIDQRSFPRPMDGNGDGVLLCDMGAYELAPPPTPEVTVEASGAFVASYRTVPIPPGGPPLTTFSVAVEFTLAMANEPPIGVCLQFSALPESPLIYKVMGSEWRQLYPTDEVEGISDVTLDTGARRLCFTIEDNSAVDGDPTEGTIGTR